MGFVLAIMMMMSFLVADNNNDDDVHQKISPSTEWTDNDDDVDPKIRLDLICNGNHVAEDSRLMSHQ